jgi:hypothetical protein
VGDGRWRRESPVWFESCQGNKNQRSSAHLSDPDWWAVVVAPLLTTLRSSRQAIALESTDDRDADDE